MLVDALLEPLQAANRNNKLGYDTIRYSKEREKRWLEMEAYFMQMMGQILHDVARFADYNKKKKAGTVNEESDEDSDEEEEEEEDEEEESEEESKKD